MKIKSTNEIFKLEIPWKTVNISFEQINEIHKLTNKNNKKWILVSDVKELVYEARNHCHGSPNKMEEILYEKLT